VFRMRDLTCQHFSEWYSITPCWWTGKLFMWFCLHDLWRDNFNIRCLEQGWNHSMACVIFLALLLEPVFSILYYCDAVLLSLKQNLMLMCCAFKAAIGKFVLPLQC
jgi:hypothetical protein